MQCHAVQTMSVFIQFSLASLMPLIKVRCKQRKDKSDIFWSFVFRYNENHGQWKRHQRRIANVSITPVIISVDKNHDFFKQSENLDFLFKSDSFD